MAEFSPESAQEQHEDMEGVSSTNNWLKRKGARTTDAGKDELIEGAPENKRKPFVSGAEAGAGVDKEEKDEEKNKKEGQEDKFDCFMKEMKRLGEGIDSLQTTTKRLDANTVRLEDKLTDIQGRVEKTETVARQADMTAKEAREEVELLRKELATLRSDFCNSDRRKSNELRRVRKGLEKSEGYSRRFNLVIEGIEEPKEETDVQLRQKVASFIKKILALSDIQFDIAHRLGPEGRAGRKVIVKFGFLLDKDKVWDARSVLQTDENKKYKLFRDKPRGVKDREALAFKIVRAAQRTNRYKRVRFHRGKVWLDDQAYEYEDYEELPYDLRPQAIASPRSEEVVVFYSHHSPFSNHYWAPFRANDTYYATVEQFLARERALFANNPGMAMKVLDTDDPVDHSRMMYQMKEDGLDVQWKQAVPEILEFGLTEKFRQNDAAREFLLESGHRKIGEATLDAFWGIGMSLSDSRVFNFRRWSEINIMGKTLVKVRDTLGAN